MGPRLRLVTGFFSLFLMIAADGAALAQKRGGILKEYMIDSPASISTPRGCNVALRRSGGSVEGSARNVVAVAWRVLSVAGCPLAASSY